MGTSIIRIINTTIQQIIFSINLKYFLIHHSLKTFHRCQHCWNSPVISILFHTTGFYPISWKWSWMHDTISPIRLKYITNRNDYFSYNFSSSNLKFLQYIFPPSNDSKYFSLLSLSCINVEVFFSESLLQVQCILMN